MNNNNLCSLVKDLMPSYVEGLTSEETNNVIKEHIKECNSCNNMYNEMVSPLEIKKCNNIKKMDFLKKYKKVLTSIIVITSTIVMILSIGIAYFAWLFFTGGNPIVKNDVLEYGEYENFLGYSNLDIFPEKISDKCQSKYNDYYYYCRDTLFDPKCQIYASVCYSENEYNDEIKRLSEIEEKVSDKTNKIKYDNNGFNYPAYIAINGNNYCYEYALLLEEEHRIIYVFIQNIDKKEIVFDVNYLPENYSLSDSYKENEFSIYMFDSNNKDEKYFTYGKLKKKS